jgi:hypothetical protein
MTCAVALASTASFTGLLNPGEQAPAGASQPRQGDEQPAAEITGALPHTEPVQLLAMSPMPLAGLSPAAAQGSNAPSSSITRVAQQDSPVLEVGSIFGPAGKPIRIPVSLSGGKVEEYSFLMFRGLPPKLTLSAGFRLKESWAVSLRDLDNLTMEAPADFQGVFSVEVLLIKGRDAPAESRVISVEIVPQDIQVPVTAALGEAAPGPRVLTAAPHTPEAEQPSTAKRPQEAARARPAVPVAEEDAMMKRAETLLRNNDIASARLVYEHLAGNGSARAALAMAKTFDPAFFRSSGATGLKPDVAKARDWYRQAADLGDQEAPSRLNALASR